MSFNEMPVNSLDASQLDFSAFQLLSDHEEDATAEQSKRLRNAPKRYWKKVTYCTKKNSIMGISKHSYRQESKLSNKDQIFSKNTEYTHRN